MTHSLKDKVEVNNAMPLPQQMPTMSTGHLFEFCSRDYWLSLDAGMLIKWIKAISWHLDAIGRYQDDSNEQWDFVYSLGDVDFTGSGCVFEDFEGKTFAETELYEFLCWAGQRLAWLSQGGDVSSKRKVV